MTPDNVLQLMHTQWAKKYGEHTNQPSTPEENRRALILKRLKERNKPLPSAIISGRPIKPDGTVQMIIDKI